MRLREWVASEYVASHCYSILNLLLTRSWTTDFQLFLRSDKWQIWPVIWLLIFSHWHPTNCLQSHLDAIRRLWPLSLLVLWFKPSWFVRALVRSASFPGWQRSLCKCCFDGNFLNASERCRMSDRPHIRLVALKATRSRADSSRLTCWLIYIFPGWDPSASGVVILSRSGKYFTLFITNILFCLLS